MNGGSSSRHRVTHEEVRYQRAKIENSGDCAVFRGNEETTVKGAENVKALRRPAFEDGGSASE